MEVKPGYKQTEVGMIPEEWAVARLSGVTDLQVGFAFKSAWFGKTRGPRLLRGENVGYGLADWSETRTLESRNSDAFRDYLLRPGDVVIGMDRTFTKSGAKITMIRETDCPCLLVQRVGRFIPRKCDQRFLWFVLSSEPVQAGLRLEQKGMDIPHLSRTEIQHPLAAFPPLPEQRAIAGALSDVDALVGALDRLIAKKRDLKQAAMQQLLTGQTRLSGFHGQWEVKRLAEVVKITKGQLITEKDAIHGPVPVIAGGMKPAYFHNKPNRTGKTITVSASGASAGYVAFFDTPIFASDCSTISEGNGYSIEFVYFQLQLKQGAIYKAQAGGAQPHIHAVDLMPLEIGWPAQPEQTAIAGVLGDMDAELAALEQRRDKTRALKQGMMQELLTGRIRLI